jgi:hypothetical protein
MVHFKFAQPPPLCCHTRHSDAGQHPSLQAKPVPTRIGIVRSSRLMLPPGRATPDDLKVVANFPPIS